MFNLGIIITLPSIWIFAVYFFFFSFYHYGDINPINDSGNISSYFASLSAILLPSFLLCRWFHNGEIYLFWKFTDHGTTRLSSGCLCLRLCHLSTMYIFQLSKFWKMMGWVSGNVHSYPISICCFWAICDLVLSHL